MSFSQRRVSGPVIGLKRIPSAMPVSSSEVLRLLWLSAPWIRFAALRRSSIAERSWSWMSWSVATLEAIPVTPRLPTSSS